MYKQKYLKYKQKYLKIKNKYGGGEQKNITWEIQSNYDEYIVDGTKYSAHKKVIKDKDKYSFDGNIIDITHNKSYNVKFNNAEYVINNDKSSNNVINADFKYDDNQITIIDNTTRFIETCLKSNPHNINYITFMLYNNVPEISKYLDNNYYIKQTTGDYNILDTSTENGFLIEIDSFINIPEITLLDNYKYNILVKFTMEPTSDNVFFEFLNGTCINKFKKKSPNWIQTYSFIKFESDYDNYKNTYKKKGKISKQKFKVHKDKTYYESFFGENINKKSNIIQHNDDTKLNIENFDYACTDKVNYKTGIFIEKIENSIQIPVLIENIGNVFNALFIQQNDADFENIVIIDQSNNELVYNTFIMDFFGILIQIYSALELNRNSFSHNDLHLNNVLLMKDIASDTMTLNYKYGIDNNTNDIRIYSNYIAVIIDYGRSYVNCDNVNSTTGFINKACDVKKCVSQYEYNLINKTKCTIKPRIGINSPIYNNINDVRYINFCMILLKEKIADNRYKPINNHKFLNILLMFIKEYSEYKNGLLIQGIKITTTVVLDWLINYNKSGKLYLTNPNKLVNFHINIDMVGNKDWIIDFI